LHATAAFAAFFLYKRVKSIVVLPNAILLCLDFSAFAESYNRIVRIVCAAP
jgi:hypothetical protein